MPPAEASTVRTEVDVVVVGAGVVGLAAAAGLAVAGRSVIVLERHGQVAHETTSRNSQVIHAGLYYPEGSWKARTCVLGRELVYERCAEHGLPHRETGKVLVATRADEIPALEGLARRAENNGAPGLRWLSPDELRSREPAVEAEAALLSPRTGIVDAHALSLSFQAEAEAHGAQVALHHELVGAERVPVGYRLEVRDSGGGAAEITAAGVVNSAGLAADRVAALAGLDVDALGYRLHPCKGDYFALAPSAPLDVRGLVYPAPELAGLGIHTTVDLGGRVRLGPDATYVDRIEYSVDEGKAEVFAEAAGRYLPGLRAEWLTPDGAGMRPKLAARGEGFRDFVVTEESEHGLPGWVNLVGIESPGLTAAPALAREVVQLLASL